MVSSPIAVMAEATAAGDSPASMSTLAWTTPAVAGPPGTILPAALPARWAVPAVPHATVRCPPSWPEGRRSASRVSHHIEAMLRPTSTTSTTNHQGSTSRSRGQEPNIASSPGATT